MKTISRIALFAVLPVLGFLVLFATTPLTAKADTKEEKTDGTKTAGDTGTAGKETGKDADKSTGAAKKDYRIETEKETDTGWERVKFISPEGKTVKTLRAKGAPFKMALIPKSGKHVLYTPELYMGDVAEAKVDEQGYLGYSVSLYDVKGERKWKKEFKTYPRHSGIEGVEEPWDDGISDDGERIYVNYCDEQNNYTLIVFNSTGDVVAEVKHNLLLSGIETAPDGKIISAETFQEGGKYLFFVDVDTGKTKLVKAENKIGYGRSSLHTLTEEGHQSLNTRQITIYWLDNSGISEDKVITFDNLPSDIYQLFPGGGKEK